MTKINIDGFIEAECPVLNESKMNLNKIATSPHLKVQIFLDELEARAHYEGRVREDNCTKIFCDGIHYDGICEYKGNALCLYNKMSK
jgi:hypothetical protein